MPNVIYAIRLRSDPTYEYRYVGLSTNPVQRFKDHMSDAKNPKDLKYNYPLYRWFRKHYYAVEFDILCVVEKPEELSINEIMWVHILKTRGHRLLNQTDGGAATLGWTPSEATRAGWSKTRRERQTSVGPNNGMYGRNHTEAAKLAMSEKKKGRTARNKGIPMSEEQKKKLSVVLKGIDNPSNHIRWHVTRNKYNENCKRCRKGGLNE